MDANLMPKSRVLELVRQAQRAAPGAMDQLIKMYTPLILREVDRHRGAGLVNPCLSSEDLRQEASLMLIELVKEFKLGHGVPFGSYLKHKIRWRLHNYRRRQQNQVLTNSDLDSSEGDQLATEPEPLHTFSLDHPLLRSAFRQLSPRQRMVLIKTFWEDKSFGQTAIDLGVTPQAVGALQRRALRRLRQQLSAE